MKRNKEYTLTVTQAAERAGWSTKTLYRYMSAGKLDYRQGEDGRRYLAMAEIDAMADQTSSQKAGKTRHEAMELRLQTIESRVAVLEEDLREAVKLIKPDTTKLLLEKRTLAEKMNKQARPVK